MNNKAYNVLKWLVLTALPGLGVLIGALGPTYGWENTETAVITLNAITVFLGTLTGYSSYKYNQGQENENE
ncbi:phage holin [Lactococcus petauri]|uniref:phage holin n=1 Tax=Lactococcus petauri TaxID=1940789 RepID=UPI003853A2F2